MKNFFPENKAEEANTRIKREGKIIQLFYVPSFEASIIIDFHFQLQ